MSVVVRSNDILNIMNYEISELRSTRINTVSYDMRYL